MIVQLPATASHLAAISLTGWTRRPGEAVPVLRGAVVLKGGFTVQEDPAGGPAAPLVAVPATKPPDIVVADEGTVAANGFDLEHEADIALEKAHADVVVLGWTVGAAGGCVRIGAEDWLRREPTLPKTDPDTNRNLFGWLSKTHQHRRIDAPKQEPLPDAYDAGFNNFARHGDGFTMPTTRPQLPADATVTISKQVCGVADSAPLNFRLPRTLAYTARVRAYCGHGPDRAPRWRIVDEIPMATDTLIVTPAGNRFTVLWRANWRHDKAPEAYWRLIQILPGGQ
jgi:hypothetical protein